MAPSDKKSEARIIIELGTFLVECFTELENIYEICTKKLVIPIFSKYKKYQNENLEIKPMVYLQIVGKTNTALVALPNSKIDSDKLCLDSKIVPELVGALFSFFVTFSEEQQEKFKIDMTDIFSEIIAEGL